MLVDNQSSHTTIRHTNNLFQKTYYKKYDFLTNSIEAARKIFFCISDGRNEFYDKIYIK